MKLSERAEFLLDNLDLPAASGVDDARFEHFQLALWSDDSTFRTEVKSRQIAWSFAAAADGLADAILDGRDAIFVSINQEEAQEKIRYAKRIHECLMLSGLPRMVRDSLTNVELANGARLTSLPARPPRGRARANVYLDEFAHVRLDREIYTAALPITSKGGRIRIGSSPMGASGVYWEVQTESLRRYPGYRRKSTPWWEVQSFCTSVREARRLAPAMPTQHRVDLFGNDRIKAIFANMPLEDFRQEYECEFVDETTAWITWDEIKAASTSDHTWSHGTARGKDLAPAMAAIDELAGMVERGEVEPAFAGGMDIGRTRNTSELYLVGLSAAESYPLRLAVTLDGVEFDDQEAVALHALARLPVTRLLIDRTGMGMQLAENMRRSRPERVIGVNFTNASKALWATDAKMLIQQGKTPLPADRDLAYQIHSIKKIVTASKNLSFDTGHSEKHHADKFWAWALALAAMRQLSRVGRNDEQNQSMSASLFG